MSRRIQAKQVRLEAADLAANRPHPRHYNNNEEYEYRDGSPKAKVTHIANFTKGLPHDTNTGLLLNPVDYKLFVTGIQSGDPVDFKNTPLGPGKRANTGDVPSEEIITPNSSENEREQAWKSHAAKNVRSRRSDRLVVEAANVRAWESAGAGNVFDLQGPDAQAVTMPPAPRFDSQELLAEIAEVYAMALLRDVPFNTFPLPSAEKCPKPKTTPEDPSSVELHSGYAKALAFMRSFPWLNPESTDQVPDKHNRRRVLKAPSDAFRGVTPGEQIGPYLSQFLLLGNQSLERRGTAPSSAVRRPDEGFILYGALGIDQTVRVATPNKDYMTVWEPYIDVQNGADLRGQETYEPGKRAGLRFIATPRDLATYVHYDALYEAYLNACLFLLSSGAPFDRGIPFLEADAFDKQQGFAHFGGPHILSLVTEVATRALKAVRYQKFNIHRRLRPEAMGGLFDRWMNAERLGTTLKEKQLAPFCPIADGLCRSKWGEKDFVDVLKEHNGKNNETFHKSEPSFGKDSYLLPMAFPEGSPMHPAYGAGHATVAGACVTILKAYFDHGWTPGEFFQNGNPVAYVPSADGEQLDTVQLEKPLTVEGELNKLAANIAIGRNWAGVHYYSDYIESIRMGEEIAIGLLEEQKLQYPENFTMTVPLFDGGAVRI